ncbi:amino acid adenylation domain-containing protein [Chryseolinea serpens]|uniref:Amino acid adenylation domain-containing protein n=1 Tax=Chryseolinea serpens TaxID=947013 RepID=A0A1M5XUH1_9BACT|nr:amino acid adenylation domain-containing protein [Chryseolinea serpens]SHI03447.1 amino acid adenylation domain-containing protein [Chryseolinea serpens]
METTIQNLILQSLTTHADRIALKSGATALSYADLDEQSTRFANYLCASGVLPQAFVGVYLSQRTEIIIALLGILKARCVFVPLDPAAPHERVLKQIQKAKLAFLVGQPDTSPEILSGCIQAGVSFGDFLSGIHFPAAALWSHNFSPNDRAYLYFTSGSTGQPKAILGRNESLHHFIDWEVREFGIHETDTFGQLTVPTFDVFLRDVLTPLAAGATLVIPERNEISLADWVQKNEITFLHLVPSLFKAMMKDAGSRFDKLRYVLLAGEKLLPALVKQWYTHFNRQTRLVNVYGPTETTLAKAFYVVTETDGDGASVPVGKPIPGARFIVLNDALEVCDVMEKGELYIRTPYMSFGYYDDPALTAKVFVPSPFGKPETIYKTGDMACQRPDGNFELLGRRDRQVKVRGIKVELDEIEKLLLRCPLVDEAVVVHEDTEKGVVIKAFLKSREPGRADFQDVIWNFLHEASPRHMMPQKLHRLSDIPRTVNGKVDLEKLRRMETPSAPAQRKSPATEMESKLVAIWKNILEQEDIGLDDRFYEAGGNSLNVMSLLYEINRCFQVRVSVEDFYKNDTVQLLARHLEMAVAAPVAAAPSGEAGYYPLTQMQVQLFSSLEEKHPLTYNIVNCFTIKGANVRSIDYASIMNMLVQRHESLRTYFDRVDGMPVQRVLPQGRVSITELFAHENAEDRLQPHDVYSFPLFRVYVKRSKPDVHRVTIDIHHLISDALSQSILMKEFLTLAKGQMLPEVSHQFRDFIAWEQGHAPETAAGHTEFADTSLAIQFPYYKKEWHHEENHAGVLAEEISEASQQRLKALASENGSTLFNVLYTAYFILMAKISGQRNVAVAAPVSFRHEPAFQQLVGPVFSMMIVPARIDDGTRFVDLLQVVTSKVAAAQQGHYRLDAVLPALRATRDEAVNTIFSFDVYEPQAQDREFTVEPVFHNKQTAKYPFYVEYVSRPHEGLITFRWDRSTFDDQVVKQFAADFRMIWETVLDHPEVSFADIVLHHGLATQVQNPVAIEFNF